MDKKYIIIVILIIGVLASLFIHMALNDSVQQPKVTAWYNKETGAYYLKIDNEDDVYEYFRGFFWE